MTTAYKIAVLVYVFNDQRQMLLLHRRRFPNKDLYSPIGGKLEQATGESPFACALREIHEEIDQRLSLDDIRLLGIVSERAYAAPADRPADAPAAPLPHDHAAAPTHWLMFCFEVTRPLNFPPRDIPEGRLEWIDPERLHDLPIPRTDREIIWPLIRQHARMLHTGPSAARDFFSVHIDCSSPDAFLATLEHPRAPVPPAPPDPQK
ncbi:MAG TPA: NUDIX domain-containing protein [Phycisphaerae bacterium]|nr:NUDIX domain-containing protein [Phycisphaerae bacterium]